MQAGFGDAWSAHPHGTQNAFGSAGSRPWDKEGVPGHSDPEISGEPGLQKNFSDPSDLSLVWNKEGAAAPHGPLPWIQQCLGKHMPWRNSWLLTNNISNINLTFQIALYLPDPHGQRNGIVIHLEIDKGDSFIKPVVCFRLSKVRKLRSSLIYSRSGRAYLHKTKNGKEERKKERKKERKRNWTTLFETNKQAKKITQSFKQSQAKIVQNQDSPRLEISTVISLIITQFTVFF